MNVGVFMINDNELIELSHNKNEEAINILIDKYKPIINKIIKELLYKYEIKGIDYNDLYQEGMLGLMNAIEHYNTSKNILFYTFACVCIKSSIISELRRTFRNKNKYFNESVSFEELTDKSSLINDLFVDSNSNPDSILINREEEKEFIDNFKNILTLREKEVFELKMNDFTNDEIAAVTNKSKKEIENTLFRIKSKYKRFNKENVCL